MIATGSLMVRSANLLAFLLCMVTLSAQAATLQISPVMVDLQPNESATGMTMINPGDRPLYGQMRVYRWDQSYRD